jgi:tetratricopeptide (TPR) repeat protein
MDGTLRVDTAATDRRLARFTTILAVMTVLSLFAPAAPAVGSPPPSALEQLEIDDMASLGELSAALDLLRTHLTQAMDEGAPSYAFQELLLTKSGELIGKSFSLTESPPGARRARGAEAKDLLLKNRALIKDILSLNEAIIRDYQENHLDALPDPATFFASPAWQHPQQLISLASYWLGWNGYYTSLLLTEEDSVRKQVLEEAIAGFSRAFIDFREDSITTKSLFGRGSAYRQLRLYGRAAHDFKSIRERLPRSDPLHVRCLYEEAALSFDTGNLKLASSQLQKIREDLPKAQIPKDVLLRINRLELNILVAESTTEEVEMGTAPSARDELVRKIFGELRQLAARKEGLTPQLYHYVQTHHSAFETVSYGELGAIGALAMGDSFFDRKEYDKAVPYYTKLYAEPLSILPDLMDRVGFRLAYLSSKNEQWDRTLAFLEPFPERFPGSPLAKQASSLFHVAAHAQYKRNPTPEAHAQYVASLHRYLRQCTDCPERSEVQYQLGDHYHKAGMTEQAIEEFLKVGTDSPSFAMAALQVLEFYIGELASLQSVAEAQDERWAQLYRDADRLQVRLQESVLGQVGTSTAHATAAYRALLQAKLRVFAPQDACEEILAKLSGFEGRFPDNGDLHQEVMGLRILCAYRLGRSDQGEAEIRRLTRDQAIDVTRYAFVQRLADQFYRRSQVTQRRGEGAADSAAADAALALYRELDVISRTNRDYAELINAVQLRIAQIYADRQQLAQAIDMYQQILQRNPRSADAMHALGLLYARTGQWQLALETWRRFSDGVQLGTHHWFVARYETGKALEQLGMLDRACAVAKMTLVLHPDLGDDELAEDFGQLRSRTCTEESSP